MTPPPDQSPAPDWLPALAGRFLVFDGPDGSGKTTQLKRFARLCKDAGLEVEEVREPGGTHIGEVIRSLLLDHGPEEIRPVCEMLLYMASRAQLVAQKIRPAMQAGKLVIADRFISSTLAYQGTAGGVAREAILATGRIACEECWPDLTIIFDVDEHVANRRLSPLLDRMEAKGAAFHRRVRQGYLEQAREDPAGTLVVDASGDEDVVHDRLLTGLHDRFCPRPVR